MKRVVNLPVPNRTGAPLSPAPVSSAASTAGLKAAPVLKLLQDRRFLKASKAYGEIQALTLSCARSLDIYL